MILDLAAKALPASIERRASEAGSGTPQNVVEDKAGEEMIVGLGNDILEVPRMKRELGKSRSAFKRQIFTPSEIDYCEKKRYPERHFAARFAAKEAMFKALAKGRQSDLEWRDVEIQNDENGQPHVILHGAARGLARNKHARRILVSLAHTRQWAMASIVLES